MVTAQGIVEAYNVMNLDAAGIARPDLAAGLDFLLRLRDISTFPWVSANLVRKSTGKPLFAESVTKKVGAISVGITGLIDSTVPLLFTAQEDADILPWQSVLPDLIKRLSAGCEMIILLSNLPPVEQERLVAAVPDINIILPTGFNSANSPPRLIGSTLVSQVQGRGKYLGQLRIQWQEKSFTYANEFIPIQITLPDDPKVLSIINKTKNQTNNKGISP